MCYLYDYYIEMHLTTVNGKALEKLISKKTEIKDSLSLDGIDLMTPDAVKKRELEFRKFQVLLKQEIKKKKHELMRITTKKPVIGSIFF